MPTLYAVNCSCSILTNISDISSRSSSNSEAVASELQDQVGYEQMTVHFFRLNSSVSNGLKWYVFATRYLLTNRKQGIKK